MLEVKEMKTKDYKDRLAEQIFQSRDAKGRAAQDIIKKIKELIKGQREELFAEQYLSYQSIENIDGEYYLLRKNKDLAPLKEYLAANEVEVSQIIKWLQTILDLFEQAAARDLDWSGILPASLWVDNEGALYIIDPLVTEEIMPYREELKFDFNAKLLLPPEIIKGKEWDARAQIYSISAFFYYLLTAKPLFKEVESARLMFKIKNIQPLEPHIINPKLSAELSTLVLDLLAKEKQYRPQGFKIVNRRLERLIDNKQLLSSAREEKKTRVKQILLKSLFKIKETSFYFAYKYGKMTIAIVVALGVVLSFALSGGYKEVIDKETSAQEVVDYFYKSINHKRINRFKETIEVEKLPHIESMIMHGYIIETGKKLFSMLPKIGGKNLPREEKIVFKIED